MAKINLTYSLKYAIWCEENISPQAYWIHNKIGGRGWAFIIGNRTQCSYLQIDNEEDALMFKLKFKCNAVEEE